jgi:hypothetical protein
LIPRFDGALFSPEWKAAPADQRNAPQGSRGRTLTFKQKSNCNGRLEQRPIVWNRCAVPSVGHKLLWNSCFLEQEIRSDDSI